jgi:hypothetical protein
MSSVTFDGSGSLTPNIVNAGIGSATSVIITGYTTITQYAFHNNTQITSITIGNSVKIIQGNAFRGVSNLSSIIIPDSVEYLGFTAFYQCTSLSSVTLPTTSSFTTIWGYTFEGCIALKSIRIPDNITLIDGAPFVNSGLEIVYISSTNGLGKPSPATNVYFYGRVVTTLTTLPPPPEAEAEAEAVTGPTEIIPKTTIVLTNPTITNFSVPNKTYRSAPFQITAPTSNSSGTFSYTSSNLNVATISGSMVTIVGVGFSTITATQQAAGIYTSGTITTTFKVTELIKSLTLIEILEGKNTLGDFKNGSVIINVSNPRESITFESILLFYTAKDFQAAGMDARFLRSKGFSAKNLMSIGFSYDELVGAGFTDSELTEAGR